MKLQPLTPTLYCPFTAVLHSDEHLATARTSDWLRACSIVCDAERDARVSKARFGSLTARAYPYASSAGLQLVTDWAAWLFLRDDMCDEAGLRADPEAMRQQCHLFVRVLLEGPCDGDEADPLVFGLSDLRRRMLACGGHAWLARFAGPIIDYFDACVWEATNRALHRVPSSLLYKAMRRSTSGVLPCLTLIELTDGIRLPLHLRDDHRVRRLVEIANDVICWSNDIFSAEKELRERDFHNLVILLMRELNCDMGVAMRAVAQMHDADVHEFERIVQSLGPTDDSLLEFIAVLQAWIRGNMDWSLQSGRYAG